MFALIKDNVVIKYPYTLTDMRRDNPQTSFADSASDQTMAEFGAQRVFFTTQPAVLQTQNAIELTPAFSQENQRWEQVWAVVDKSEAEVQAKADEIRAQRDQLLAECDWTQLPDAPVDQEAWASYRQALRDIPSQAGFPWDVVWPTKP